MEDINYYINKSQNMESTSDGGSKAYYFDDVVLIKYENYNKYGLAREQEELVRKEANKKRDNGVNTPYHYAIKREIDGDKNICWVLQQRAKGVSFSKYFSSNNNGKRQLKLQEELANLSNDIYDKLVSDLMQLFNMGLELKSKNIYLDLEDGFTFIDLLNGNGQEINCQSLEQINRLDYYLSFVTNFSTLYYESNIVSLEDIEKSKQLSLNIQLKIFQAMQRMIPQFKEHERWLLRGYSAEKLEYFKKNGIDFDNLSLTDEEEQQFDSYIEVIIGKCLTDISLGIKTLSNINVNEIRILLSDMGLNNSWPYHKEYPQLDINDYEDLWELNHAQKESLENKVKEQLYERIQSIESDNANIIQAKEDIEKLYSRRYK